MSKSLMRWSWGAVMALLVACGGQSSDDTTSTNKAADTSLGTTDCPNICDQSSGNIIDCQSKVIEYCEDGCGIGTNADELVYKCKDPSQKDCTLAYCDSGGDNVVDCDGYTIETCTAGCTVDPSSRSAYCVALQTSACNDGDCQYPNASPPGQVCVGGQWYWDDDAGTYCGTW
jgi:hypothetical protein